jgi:NTP pyrophosphatase (non-canonical NTP hydrolase)
MNPKFKSKDKLVEGSVVKLDECQRMAVETAIYPGQCGFAGKIYCALKLNGEAGEVAEKIGKAIRDDGSVIAPERRADLKKEFGDVLWHLANLAAEFGFSLSDIASENISKTTDRKARGALKGSGDNR